MLGQSSSQVKEYKDALAAYGKNHDLNGGDITNDYDP